MKMPMLWINAVSSALSLPGLDQGVPARMQQRAEQHGEYDRTGQRHETGRSGQKRSAVGWLGGLREFVGEDVIDTVVRFCLRQVAVMVKASLADLLHRGQGHDAMGRRRSNARGCV